MRSLLDQRRRRRPVVRHRPSSRGARIGRQMLRPLFVIAVLAAAAVMDLAATAADAAWPAAAPTEPIPIRTASSPLAIPTVDFPERAAPAQQPGPVAAKPGPDEGCRGPGCIVAPARNTQAGSTAPGAAPAAPADPAQTSSCSFFDWGACISGAIDSLSRHVVTDALNPMLDLLTDTLLTTPAPAAIPRLVELWTGSWEVLLACYGLLILIAGIVLMAYETVQTRYGLREIAPRLVLGLLTGALSLTVAGMAVDVANALSEAVLGEKIGESAGADALSQMITSALTTDSGALLLLIMGVALAGALLALLLTYVMRVAITLVLIAGAPIALMFHALPQTEGIARWWWRTLAACLAIQIVQSITLITALHVLLTPGGGFGLWTEGTGNGFGTLLFVLALLYILCKIPSWLLSASKIGGGRSVLGSLARSFIAYKTFGLLGGGKGGKASSTTGRRGPGGPGRGGRGRAGSPTTPTGPSDPYATTKATADGQLMLPLDGLARRRAQRATTTPPPAHPGGRPTGAGRQLALPLVEGDWPENRPKLGADGQYRLPLDLARTPAAKAASAPVAPAPRSGPAGRQLALPLTAGDWPENRPKLGADGQYQLPLNVRRTRPVARPTAATRSATTPPTGAASATRGRAQQLELLFDPYARDRPLRGGQYPLPLEGVNRQPRPSVATPATGRPATAARRRDPTATPSPATRAPRARQLTLPIPPRAATTPSANPPTTPRTAAPPSSSSRRVAAPTGATRPTPPTSERPRRPGRAAVPDRAAPITPPVRPPARRATRPTRSPPAEPPPTPPPGGQPTRPAPRRRARPPSGDDSS